MGAARWFSRVVIFNCGRDVEYDLRNDLFAHLCNLDQVFYQRIKTGDLMSRMINDLSAVRMMVGMGVLSFTNIPVTFFFALVLMFSLSPRLTARRDDPVRDALLCHALAHAHADGAQPRRAGRPRRYRRRRCRKASRASTSSRPTRSKITRRERFREINDEYNEQGLALARVRGATDADNQGHRRHLGHDRADLWRHAGARPRASRLAISSPSWATSARSRGRRFRSAGRSPFTSADAPR